MLHTSQLASPDILQFELNSLDRKQKSEQSVVLLCDIWAKHEMDGPLTVIVK